MCSSCGCGIPEETHDDPRNILFSQLTTAAAAQGISENDVVNNMHTMVHESHKIDQKFDPEPIKDAKTKLLSKDWAEWDAEREAEEAGLGRGFKKFGRLRSMRTKEMNSGVLNIHTRMHHGRSMTAHEHALHHIRGQADHTHSREPGLRYEGRSGHDGGTRKMLHKVVRTLGEEMADAIIKGQRREEKGRFVPGQDNTHSHKLKGEIITHTHDGERGHTHPARDYGPSFNHK